MRGMITSHVHLIAANILKLVEDNGIEPLTVPCKGTVFPIIPIPQNLAPKVGIEPTTNWLTANCTTAVLLRNRNLIKIFCFTFIRTLGRGTENRTLIYWLKASYFSR